MNPKIAFLWGRPYKQTTPLGTGMQSGVVEMGRVALPSECRRRSKFTRVFGSGISADTSRTNRSVSAYRTAYVVSSSANQAETT